MPVKPSSLLCIIPGLKGGIDESEFVAKYSTNPPTTMSKSGTTHSTAPTLMMNELSLGRGESNYSLSSSNASSNNSNSLSSSSSSSSQSAYFQTTPAEDSNNSNNNNSNSYRYSPQSSRSSAQQSSSSRSPVNNRRSAAFDEQETASIETPLHMKPYVTQEEQEANMTMLSMSNCSQHQHQQHNLQPYVVSSSLSSQQQKYQEQQMQPQQQMQRFQSRTVVYNKEKSIIVVPTVSAVPVVVPVVVPTATAIPVPMKQQLRNMMTTSSSQNNNNNNNNNRRRANSHRLPRVTKASTPFEKTIAPTSYLHDELSKDEAYNHAMRCGVVWQSLVGSAVKFPSLWYDGEEPARPYMGCPSKSNKWSFFGRHRMTLGSSSSNMLRTLVRDSRSSGKLLLHIIARDSNTFEPTEDIVVGVFHPNAKGIRPRSSSSSSSGGGGSINLAESQFLDDCRDIWIGHRSRSIPIRGKRQATRIESLLRYLNKQSVDKSPLGPKNTQGILPYHVDNTNMNSIYGRNPPKSTLFVPENKLYKLLTPPPSPSQQQHESHRGGGNRRAANRQQQQQQQQQPIPPQTPASVTLMKLFLQQ